MKHLKKYNESNKSDKITYKNIIDLVNNNQIETINNAEKYIVKYINNMVDLNNRSRRVNILNKQIGSNSGLEHILIIGDKYVVIVENGKPNVLIQVDGMVNPFEFGDVVVLPGYDYIICYNKITGEHKKSLIR